MFATIRAPILGAIASAVLAALSVASLAGPGHDHGPAEAPAAAPSSPRVVAVSESYEFVGILKEKKLTVYLDRVVDTSPVLDAKIELTIDGESGIAEPQKDGTYIFKSPVLEKSGDHEVIITVGAEGGSDLLIGTLKDVKVGEHYDHDHADHHRDEETASGKPHSGLPSPLGEIATNIGIAPTFVARILENAALFAGLGLAFGVMIGALVSGRAGLVIGIIGVVTVFGAGMAFAGPGHDHGDGGATAIQGDGPRRLPDGELFLPKPTQRLLDIRTRRLKTQTARRADRLIGRVIADPNRSGLVQSTIGGRIRTAESGLPALGQSVKKGQVLAFVEPAFAPIDASDVRQTAGDLQQRIAVLDARIARQKKLVAKGVVNAASLEDLEIERAGLEARRKQLEVSRIKPEPLVAPVDGIIANVHVVAGQVVASADTLFDIVDPASLWVEAISFDPRVDPTTTTARAKTSDDEMFNLTFVGRSRALQQQATVLQFRVTRPNDALNIGSPVKVLIEKGEAIRGLVVPRSAIAQAPNGQMVAFKRLEPERYLPLAVSIEDLDSERVRVTGGLKPGDQIVVRGAPLVNQIR